MLVNTDTTMGSMTDYDDNVRDAEIQLEQLVMARQPELVERRPGKSKQWCGCKEGRFDKTKCKKYKAKRTREMWMTAFTIAAAVGIFTLIPSWKAAVAMVLVSVLVSLSAPMSDVACVAAPVHLASAVYLLSCGLKSYAGLATTTARTTAVACMCMTTLAVAQYEPGARL